MKRETSNTSPLARPHKSTPQRKRARQDGSPPVASRTHVTGEPAMCERCSAVYERKTWRAAERTRSVDPYVVTWTLCPACAQVEDQEYFGRVRVTQVLSEERLLAVRRRIWNVERRARHTQPERRMVSMERTRTGLEVLTTSQKLAHRIARELEKAFGGRAHYEWTGRERMLDATWDPEEVLEPRRRTKRAHPARRA